MESTSNFKEEANSGKKRSPLNRTLRLSQGEYEDYRHRLGHLDSPIEPDGLDCRIIHQDLLGTLDFLPDSFVDLLFLDPPYNLNKAWHTISFRQSPVNEYASWMDSWLSRLVRVLKPDASVYICGDWLSSAVIHAIASKYFVIRNRITWEREKGRGAKSNWKNCSEDIWFCTISDDYYFNSEVVKLKRQVIAPYIDSSGEPRGWDRTEQGNYRLTSPSNLWTDITVPFWSMPENTDHPTQKPEKLLAKIILASSEPGDLVFDPFLGVGTTAVVAKKLGRSYLGIEIDDWYCCLAEKRLALAEFNPGIQGYSQGVFWDRNTSQGQQRRSRPRNSPTPLL